MHNMPEEIIETASAPKDSIIKEKSYVCEICAQAFSNVVSLVGHRIHMGQLY